MSAPTDTSQPARPRVWFERAVLPDLLATVRQQVEVVRPGPTAAPLDGLERARGAVVGVHPIDATALASAPGLLVVARTGIGVDSVAVDAATDLGIAVCNTPDAPTVSTAEHAVALLLAACKRLDQVQRRQRAGEADLYARHDGMELAGAVLGLVGFGRIAQRVATVARALGMQVAVFDPYLDDTPDDVARQPSLAALLGTADVVSVHVPLTPETAGTFDAAAFAAMRPGAVFVNTARGGLVDHDALLAALADGHLFAAALDVTEPEPLPPDHPLLHRDDVVVTPHVATATRAGRHRLLRTAFEQVLDVLAGRRPPHLVNPDVWPRVARRPDA